MKLTAIFAAALVFATTTFVQPAKAQSCWQGEIQVFVMKWCPRGYMPLDGRSLQINAHQSLFSLLGTTYGGDGRTTFKLPDMRGRGLIGAGSGPGLNARSIGQHGGSETQTLSVANLPGHSHDVKEKLFGNIRAQVGVGDTKDPAGASPATSSGARIYASTSGNPVDMRASTVVTQLDATSSETGSWQAMGIMDPFLVLNPCICAYGLYPSRPPSNN